MNKYILLLALVGVVFTTHTCTDGTNGKTVNGVCQFYDLSSLCSSYETFDTCTTANDDNSGCVTNGVYSTQTNKCTCSDGTNDKIKVDAGSTVCSDTAAADKTACPVGYGIATNTCTVFTAAALGCKESADNTTCAGETCLDNGADTPVAGDSTNAACAAPTGFTKLINFVGYVEACPDGYYDASDVCTPCKAGCKDCSASSTCLSCASGFLLVSEACVAVDETNACSSECNGCTTLANNCVACADNHVQIAPFESVTDTSKVCTPTISDIQGCGVQDDTVTDKKQCKADGCVTGFTWNATTLMCDCDTAGQGAQLFGWTADDASTADVDETVLAGWRCGACDPVCDATLGKECRMDGTGSGAPKCQDIPGWVPPADCDDEALVKAGCHTCALPTTAAEGDPKVCSKCFADARAAETDGSCKCENKVDQALWTDADGKAKECKTCATVCGSGKFCKIKADGTEDACSDTQANDSPSGGSGSGASNANILSAALAILAIILA